MDGMNGLTRMGSTAGDPNMNPNLKQTKSLNSEGTDYNEDELDDAKNRERPFSLSSAKNDVDVDEIYIEHDHALDILAGGQKTKGYEDNSPNEQDDLLELETA